jgi:hypothetical protein
LVKVPRVFSFIRDPEKALQTIGDFVSAGRSRFVERVHVDHSELEHYELAAEAVLDVIALDVDSRRIRTGNRMLLSGRFPNNADAQRFVRAIGISRYLNIPGTALPASEGTKLVVFEQTQRTPDPRARVPISSEKATVILEFADHIGKCLSTVGMQLSAEDRQNLCKYTGELIDNVEQHGRSRDWYLSSFLDTSLVPPVCEVAIYNFGRTFAETFLSLPPGSYARKLVEPYVALHDHFRFFGPSWRVVDLLTVVALQGGISSKRVDEDDMRGQGTVDLIEFFEAVSDSCSQSHGVRPEMAIISGDTPILFAGALEPRGFPHGEGSSHRAGVGSTILQQLPASRGHFAPPSFSGAAERVRCPMR